MKKLIVTMFATLMLAMPGVALADQGSSEPKPSESPAVVPEGGDFLPATGTSDNVVHFAMAGFLLMVGGGFVLLAIKK